MAYKKQLKDKDGNTIYPDVGLNLDDVVYADDPTQPVENPEPWVKASDMIGGETLATLAAGSNVEVVGSGNNICWKYANGFMIAMVKKTQSVTFAAWGDVAETETVLPPNFAVPFVSTPCCSVSVVSCGLQCWVGLGSGRNNTSGYDCSATRGQGVVLHRTNTGSTNVTLNWIAIGMWK